MAHGKKHTPEAPSKISAYEIKLCGEIDVRWHEWFNGITISTGPCGDRYPVTTMTCSAMDQAKLRGVLNKIWDLNLCLLSVRRIHDPAPGECSG